MPRIRRVRTRQITRVDGWAVTQRFVVIDSLRVESTCGTKRNLGWRMTAVIEATPSTH